MLVTALGLLLVLVVALGVTWPMIAPRDGGAGLDPLVDPRPARSDAERRRDAALAAIREAEFDHRVGKLSDDDLAGLRGELEQAALAAIADLDRDPAAGAATPAAAAPSAGGSFCASCGKALPGDARFCHGCGKPVAAARPRRSA